MGEVFKSALEVWAPWSHWSANIAACLRRANVYFWKLKGRGSLGVVLKKKEKLVVLHRSQCFHCMWGFSHKPKHVAGSQGDSISVPAILAYSPHSAAVLLYYPAAHNQQSPATNYLIQHTLREAHLNFLQATCSSKAASCLVGSWIT